MYLLPWSCTVFITKRQKGAIDSLITKVLPENAWNRCVDAILWNSPYSHATQIARHLNKPMTNL